MAKNPGIFAIHLYRTAFSDTTKIKKKPLVNIQKTMEHDHVQWVNPLFLWSCSIAIVAHIPIKNPHVSNKSGRC